MTAIRMLLILAPALLLPACSANLSRHASGLSVAEKNGRFFVDSVALDFHREVTVAGEVAGALLLTSHTGLVDVVAVPGDRYELVVDVYSEVDEQGVVEVVDGQLMAGGHSGQVVINGVRGRVPDSIDLTVMNGTGNVVLTSFHGSDVDLVVDAGTGAVNIVDCTVSSIVVDSGTGAVHVRNSKAQVFELDTATASLMADDSEFVRFRGESGTGDFRFRGSRMHWARFTSATGDVVLADSFATEVAATLGTGRVIERELPVAAPNIVPAARQPVAPAAPARRPAQTGVVPQAGAPAAAGGTPAPADDADADGGVDGDVDDGDVDGGVDPDVDG